MAIEPWQSRKVRRRNQRSTLIRLHRWKLWNDYDLALPLGRGSSGSSELRFVWKHQYQCISVRSSSRNTWFLMRLGSCQASRRFSALSRYDTPVSWWIEKAEELYDFAPYLNTWWRMQLQKTEKSFLQRICGNGRQVDEKPSYQESNIGGYSRFHSMSVEESPSEGWRERSRKWYCNQRCGVAIRLTFSTL